MVVPSTTATTAPPATTTTLPAAAVWEAVPAGEVNILFVGNSHTATHDVPGTVAELLEAVGSYEPMVTTLSASFLRRAMERPDITEEISSGNWDVVILQGHEISMSHSTRYSQEEPVGLARLAIEAGSRALFFSEWKRKGIDETAYIEDLYQELAAKSGAEVIPIGRSWDRFLAEKPEAELWLKDGNHASEQGAYLAAAAITYYLAGPDAEIEATTENAGLLAPAQEAIRAYLEHG